MVILLCIFLCITTIFYGSENEYQNFIDINYSRSNRALSIDNSSEYNGFRIHSNYESVSHTKPNNITLYYEEPIYYLREKDPQQPKSYKALCCGCISCSTILSVIGFLVFQSP